MKLLITLSVLVYRHNYFNKSERSVDVMTVNKHLVDAVNLNAIICIFLNVCITTIIVSVNSLNILSRKKSH